MSTTGYRGATAEAIRHHYDVSDDFYALWLAVVALVVTTLWLPEIPLSKHNRIEPPAFE